METLMDVVTGVEITSQDSLVVYTNQLFDHFSGAGVMIFIIPDRRGADTPDIAVAPILSPAGLICLDGWTGTDFPLETLKHWLRIRGDPMQEFHQFSQTDWHAVQGLEHLPKLAQGQAHHGAQIRDHTG